MTESDRLTTDPRRNAARPQPSGGRRRPSKSALPTEVAEPLDLPASLSFYISRIGNEISSSGSSLLLRRFGVGITEARVMAILRRNSDVYPYRVGQAIGLDKSVVSRALVQLEDQGYARRTVDPSDPRRQLWRLTPAGETMVVAISEVQVARNERLAAGLSETEREQLGLLLARVLAGISGLTDYDRG